MCGCFQTFHCDQPWKTFTCHSHSVDVLMHQKPCSSSPSWTVSTHSRPVTAHFFLSPTHCRFLEQSLYGKAAEHFWQAFPQILWKSQPPGLVPYFECSCLALAQREYICQLSQDINIHIVSHPLQLTFKAWEYWRDALEDVKGYYFLL